MLVKIVLCMAIAALGGALVGVSEVAAEYISSIYVEGAGYVGFARTNGWNSSGYMNVWGQSSSSVTLKSITAWAKIWHPGYDFPPLLTAENSKSWANSKGGQTATIQSGLYGDYAATRSTHRVVNQRGTTTYTSHPDNYASCYGKWIGNQNC